jgi:anti-sigma B factor antagonist
MDININKNSDGITVVEMAGDIDASTASQVQEKVLGAAEEKSKILMDMTNVPYMSSAGLRMLLSVYRQVTGKEGKLVIVGLSEEIEETMDVTGFLDFFTVRKTIAEGLTELQ